MNCRHCGDEVGADTHPWLKDSCFGCWVHGNKRYLADLEARATIPDPPVTFQEALEEELGKVFPKKRSPRKMRKKARRGRPPKGDRHAGH